MMYCIMIPRFMVIFELLMVSVIAFDLDYKHIDDVLPTVDSENSPNRVIKSHVGEDLNTPNVHNPVFDNCRLDVNDKIGQRMFKKMVTQDGFVRVPLKLNFQNSALVQGNNSDIIQPDVWTWFYDGEDGSRQYLDWPEEALIWSFGLLKISAIITPIPITLRAYNCPATLDAGTHETNNVIGEALAKMTRKVLTNDLDKVDEVYWCYSQKTKLYGQVWKHLCKNVICPFILTKRVCCVYDRSKLSSNQTKDIKKCDKEVYTNHFQWSTFPCVLGVILFVYSPFMVLLYAVAMVQQYPVEPSVTRQLARMCSNVDDRHESGSDVEDDIDTDLNVSISLLDDQCKERFVSLETDPCPVTVTGTILQPIKSLCPLSRVTVSRIVRFFFPILVLSIIFLEVVLDRVYLHSYVTSCIYKSVPLGFRSVAVGFYDSMDTFLPLFKGPYVALAFFVGLSWISLIPPRDCGEHFRLGVSDYSRTISPLCLPIDAKEMLGSVEILDKPGYEKILKYLQSHIFMVFNSDFWHLSFLIFKGRFVRLWKCVPCDLHPIFRSIFLVVPYIILLIVCMVEMVLATILYICPVISYGYICTKSTTKAFDFLTVNRQGLGFRFLRLLFAMTYTILFSVAYFMYCLIFLESFMFISRVAVFTYAGIIRYPKESYGIIIFSGSSLYYFVEKIRGFGEFYSSLLEITISVAKKLPQSNKNVIRAQKTKQAFFISREFFEFVISQTRPRRVQLLVTLLKCGASISLVSLSVFLVSYFGQYAELNVIIQVITILLICAIPISVNLLCSSKGKERQKYIQRKSNIRRIVRKYIDSKAKPNDQMTDAVLIFQKYGIPHSGYQQLP